MKQFVKPLLIAVLGISLLPLSTSACQGSGDNATMKMQGGDKHHLIRNVVDALSQTGLSTKQVASMTQAINTFKAKRMAMKSAKRFPIDAFGDKTFDAKGFKAAKQKQFDAKIGAVTELFTTIYATLTPEQRPLFKRAFTAPMVEKMLRKDMIKGGMKGSQGGKGMKCGGN